LNKYRQCLFFVGCHAIGPIPVLHFHLSASLSWVHLIVYSQYEVLYDPYVGYSQSEVPIYAQSLVVAFIYEFVSYTNECIALLTTNSDHTSNNFQLELQ